MGELSFRNGKGKYRCFTAYLKVDYRSPIPYMKNIVICTKVIRREGRKIYMRSEVRALPAAYSQISADANSGLFSQYLGETLLYSEGDALYLVMREDSHKM